MATDSKWVSKQC